MISYFRFLLLSMPEREQYLTERAPFLLSYADDTKELRLYAVNDFFAEMHLDEQKLVTEIISFKRTGRLEQHTRHLSLRGLQTSGVTGGHLKDKFTAR
ncbi:hypothetical protein GXP67_31210 [Rhodocytophaga rosea]|uniref:Uncharacterized protein n=1 Tax=Rhodocytophaga rosea TaxID=2704465 RepID=A0A6C0GI07_9BACT|nr:hypothetical protein [Rhodocytophaga rosea]QHT67333.1 hypothetical protein GXP67_12155 [Rhodocytophaga rosea]QHT70802.1 hypothetical protein GXP67_31210 [Rhodocytophaga rosea]